MCRYILRINTGVGGAMSRGVRYGTVQPSDLKARFADKLRVRRTIQSGIGPIRELEATGKDRSRIELRFTGDDIVNDRGNRGLYPGNTQFPLLDRHKHMRVLTREDDAQLTELDCEIAEKVAELRALQDNRAEQVAKAWRRAEKVAIDELEEKANA